jgi:hypothetical protein
MLAAFYPAMAGTQAQSATSSQAPEATPATDSQTRVYVTDSQSWQVGGGWAASNGFGGGATSGGARPQTAEIVKTFNERCPSVIVTNNKERANYVVILDDEGGKGYARRDNKIAVFNRDGNAIFSDSTRSLGNAVKDACAAIEKKKP